MTNDALGTYSHAMQLFPRNVPLTVRYAEALMKADKPKQAHEILLDLFNNVPPTPAQIRLTALAASAAGDMGDAYYYMSEYHISSGELPLSAQQLELALASPNLTPVQKERFQARLDEIREYLAEDRRAARARQASDDGGGGSSR
jgi:predicted Zn-dependent protease